MNIYLRILTLIVLNIGIWENAHAKFYFGLKGGLNIASIKNLNKMSLPEIADIATLNFNTDGSTTYRIGYNAGLFVNFATKNNRWAFQPEVLFSKQGTKNVGKFLDYEDYSVNTSISADYINIPLLIQLYFIKNILYVEAGPQLGFMTNSSAAYTIDSDLNGHYDGTWDTDLNTFDFSVALGIGLKIPALPIGVNFRYLMGLSNVAQSNTQNNKTYNSVFQLDAFLKFGK